MSNWKNPARIYEHANAAAREAIELRRNGQDLLAKIRSQDAAALRQMAREAVQEMR